MRDIEKVLNNDVKGKFGVDVFGRHVIQCVLEKVSTFSSDWDDDAIFEVMYQVNVDKEDRRIFSVIAWDCYTAKGIMCDKIIINVVDYEEAKKHLNLLMQEHKEGALKHDRKVEFERNSMERG